MAAENEPDPPTSLADANTQLTITTNLPDTLCPGEPIEVCANLSQRCGGDNLVPLPGRSLIFFANAGDCGANVGQAGEDTVLTDAQGNACFVVTVSSDTGLFAIRVKFQGEDKPDPCPDTGNNACNPTDPAPNKRCTNLSAANVCVTFVVDTSVCGCGSPIINCPAYVTQVNDAGQCGATVDFSVQAAGKCAPLSISCTPPSGSFFLVGTTTVACAATDTAGNSSACSFPVSVQDAEEPQLFCPENISVTTGPAQGNVSVSYSASATDNCATSGVVCSPPSGSLFPVGVTTVVCRTTDASKNSSSCSFAVTVNSFLFFQRSGGFAGDQLGFSVAGGGDVNNDGLTDFLVSIPGADMGGTGNSAILPDAGALEIFSGADGGLLLHIDGFNEGDRLGGSAGIGGDVNQDGFEDFIAGSPEADVNGLADAGAAYVFSGADGSVLYEIKGTAPADRLGGSAGIINDVNSDGYDDFAVTAPGADGGGTGGAPVLEDAGAVYVFSGLDGGLLYQINGEEAANRLGGSLGVGGDVDADGVEDFIAGAPEADINGLVDAGAAYVFSGKNGQLLYPVYGTAPGDQLGSSVGISGNVDGVGGDDFVIGVPGKDVFGGGNSALLADAGAVYVYSGSDGSLLHQIDGFVEGDRLGGSAGIADDVNGDGFGDFFAGSPEADPNGLVDAGSVTVFSGASGQSLFTVDGSSGGDRLGGSAGVFESAADAEAGPVRFLIGAPGTDFGPALDAGSAFVYQIAYKGDLNGDGNMTSADVVLLLYCIFLDKGFCSPSVADLDCDGSLVSPSDVVILLNAIFLGQPVTCIH